jgi:hypothetical protein
MSSLNCVHYSGQVDTTCRRRLSEASITTLEQGRIRLVLQQVGQWYRRGSTALHGEMPPGAVAALTAVSLHSIQSAPQNAVHFPSTTPSFPPKPGPEAWCWRTPTSSPRVNGAPHRHYLPLTATISRTWPPIASQIRKHEPLRSTPKLPSTSPCWWRFGVWHMARMGGLELSTLLGGIPSIFRRSSRVPLRRVKWHP